MFKELTSINITEPVEDKQCDFDHSEWTSKKVIEIGLISEEASKKLGLKKGDMLTFTCEETTDYPNGNDCEKED